MTVSAEDRNHQLHLLEIHRKNARLYQRQLNMHTEGYVPPAILNGLRESLKEISRVKKILRGWEIMITDQEGDTYDLSAFD